MFNKTLKHTIKIISIMLSLLMVWQNVVWANPDVAKPSSIYNENINTLQAPSMFTHSDVISEYERAFTGYLTSKIIQTELDPNHRNLSAMYGRICLDVLEVRRGFTSSGRAPEVDPISFVKIDKNIPDGYFSIDMGDVVFRYYDPNIPGSDFAGNEYEVLEQIPVGRYLIRQKLAKVNYVDGFIARGSSLKLAEIFLKDDTKKTSLREAISVRLDQLFTGIKHRIKDSGLTNEEAYEIEEILKDLQSAQFIEFDGIVLADSSSKRKVISAFKKELKAKDDNDLERIEKVIMKMDQDVFFDITSRMNNNSDDKVRIIEILSDMPKAKDLLSALKVLEKDNLEKFTKAINLLKVKPVEADSWLLGVNTVFPGDDEKIARKYPNTIALSNNILDLIEEDAALLEEYMFHEFVCPHFGHERARQLQERMFPENYKDISADEQSGHKDGQLTLAIKKVLYDACISYNGELPSEADIQEMIKRFKEYSFKDNGPQKATRIYSMYTKWHTLRIKQLMWQTSRLNKENARKSQEEMKVLEERNKFMFERLTWIWDCSVPWDNLQSYLNGRTMSDLREEQRARAKELAEKVKEVHNAFTLENKDHVFKTEEYIRNVFSDVDEILYGKKVEVIDEEDRDGPVKVDVIFPEQSAEQEERGKTIVTEKSAKPSKKIINEKEKEKRVKKGFFRGIKDWYSRFSFKNFIVVMSVAVVFSFALYLILPVNTWTLTIATVVPLALFVALLARNFSWEGLFFAVAVSFFISYFLPLPWLGLSLAITLILASKINGQSLFAKREKNNIKGASRPSQKGASSSKKKDGSLSEEDEEGAIEGKDKKTTAQEGEDPLKDVKISKDVFTLMFELVLLLNAEDNKDKEGEEKTKAREHVPGEKLDTKRVLDAVFRLDYGEPLSYKPEMKEDLRKYVYAWFNKPARSYDSNFLQYDRILKSWKTTNDDKLVEALQEVTQEISSEVLSSAGPDSVGEIVAIRKLVAEHYAIEPVKMRSLRNRLVLLTLRDRVKSGELVNNVTADEYYNLGRFELLFDFKERSERAFSNAVFKDLGNKDYYLTLAIVNHYLQNWNKAEKTLKKTIEMRAAIKEPDPICKKKHQLALLLLKKVRKKITLNGDKSDEEGPSVSPAVIMPLKNMLVKYQDIYDLRGYTIKTAPFLEEAIFNLIPFLVSSALLYSGYISFTGFIAIRAVSAAFFTSIHIFNMKEAPKYLKGLAKIKYIFYAPSIVSFFNILMGIMAGFIVTDLIKSPFPSQAVPVVIVLSLLVYLGGKAVHKWVNEGAVFDRKIFPASIDMYPGSNRIFHLIYSGIIRYLWGGAKGKEFLEIGFGANTTHWRSLSAVGVHISAIDINEKHVLEAKSLYKKANVVAGDITNTKKFSKKKFDVIYMRHVLASLNTPEERKAIISSVKNRLKRDGILVIYDVDLEPLHLFGENKDVENYFKSIDIPFLIELSGMRIVEHDKEENILVAKISETEDEARSYLANMSKKPLWKVAVIGSTIFHELGHFVYAALAGQKGKMTFKEMINGRIRSVKGDARKYGGLLGNAVGLMLGAAGFLLWFLDLTGGIALYISAYLLLLNGISYLLEFLPRGDMNRYDHIDEGRLFEILEDFYGTDIFLLEGKELVDFARVYAFRKHIENTKGLDVENMAYEDLAKLLDAHLKREIEIVSIAEFDIEKSLASSSLVDLFFDVHDAMEMIENELRSFSALYEEAIGKLPEGWDDLLSKDRAEIKTMCAWEKELKLYYQNSMIAFYPSLKRMERILRDKLTIALDFGIASRKDVIEGILNSLPAEGRSINDKAMDWIFLTDPIAGDEELHSSGGLKYLYQGNPYDLIIEVLKELKLTEDDILYDIGSGYGRVIFTASILTDVGEAVGVELAKARTEKAYYVAGELELDNVSFIDGDAAQADIEEGTVFFMDLSTLDGRRDEAVRSIGRQLKEIASKKKIRIVAQGATRSYFDEEREKGWLSKGKTFASGGHEITIYTSLNDEEQEKQSVELEELEQIVRREITDVPVTYKRYTPLSFFSVWFREVKEALEAKQYFYAVFYLLQLVVFSRVPCYFYNTDEQGRLTGVEIWYGGVSPSFPLAVFGIATGVVDLLMSGSHLPPIIYYLTVIPFFVDSGVTFLLGKEKPLMHEWMHAYQMKLLEKARREGRISDVKKFAGEHLLDFENIHKFAHKKLTYGGLAEIYQSVERMITGKENEVKDQPKSSSKMWLVTFGSIAINVIFLTLIFLFSDTFLKDYVMPLPFYPGVVIASISFIFTVAGISIGAWTSAYHPWREFRDKGMIYHETPSNVEKGGPYRFLRHPMYFAVSLVAIASNLIMFTSFGFIAYAPVFIVNVFILYLFNSLAKKEESELIEKFGDEYREYLNATNRWLPRFFVRKKEKSEEDSVEATGGSERRKGPGADVSIERMKKSINKINEKLSDRELSMDMRRYYISRTAKILDPLVEKMERDELADSELQILKDGIFALGKTALYVPISRKIILKYLLKLPRKMDRVVESNLPISIVDKWRRKLPIHRAVKSRRRRGSSYGKGFVDAAGEQERSQGPGAAEHVSKDPIRLEYGRQSGVVPEDIQSLEANLVRLFTAKPEKKSSDNSMIKEDAEKVAATFARAKEGSLEILKRTGVVTDIEIKALRAFRNTPSLFDTNALQALKARVLKIVNDYYEKEAWEGKKLTAKQRNDMMRRLLPVGMIEELSGKYEVSPGIMLSIVLRRPNFLFWLDEAKEKVDAIEKRVKGSRNAWLLVKDKGTENIDSWISSAEAKVDEIYKKVGGKRNAWTVVISQGINNADAWVRLARKWVKDNWPVHGSEAKAWRYISSNSSKIKIPKRSSGEIKDIGVGYSASEAISEEERLSYLRSRRLSFKDSAPKTNVRARTREKILKNAEVVVPRLINALIAAGDKGEKIVLALDEDLGKGEINDLLRKIIRLFPDLKNNNNELERFFKDLEIIKGEGSRLANRIDNITDPRRGGVSAENLIIVTRSSNLSLYSSVEGKATIAGIDDSVISPTSYLPLTEIVLFAVGNYLGWSEEELRKCYSMIPNAIAESNMDSHEAAELFAGDRRTLVIRMVPDCVEFDKKELREIMESLRTMLARA